MASIHLGFVSPRKNGSCPGEKVRVPCVVGDQKVSKCLVEGLLKSMDGFGYWFTHTKLGRSDFPGSVEVEHATRSGEEREACANITIRRRLLRYHRKLVQKPLLSEHPCHMLLRVGGEGGCRWSSFSKVRFYQSNRRPALTTRSGGQIKRFLATKYPLPHLK